MSWNNPAWSGYVQFDASGFKSVEAEWIVPSIPSTPTDPNAIVFIWIGIGGGQAFYGQPNTPGVIQIGTGANYISGSPNYFAWWETFGMPGDLGFENNTLAQDKYPVKPGDQIHAAVYANPDTWNLLLLNTTQGWHFTSTPFYTLNTQTAEFIVEAPVKKDSSGNFTPVPLPNYGKLTFDNCTVNGVNPHFDFEKESGFMFDINNPSKIISIPSAPDSDTDGFTVAFGSTAPPPPSS
ncbi:G1 family glutamic endopeptidase [Bacillus thuringiensis]|uniref:G1 family glutamic endopeptidase n=1 Tax=Bacillus thuringiensis TaxID=1428 RepID=UPI0021E84BE6|nr:G1 family glutamic endopeptidase [Bacillus thuringiensis]